MPRPSGWRVSCSPSPLQRNARLSAATGADVYLKREDLQPVRSYKIRGAYNLMAQLPDQQRAAGVVCASAGNHAQGVALSCQLLGIRGTVYLPRTTPRQKRDRIAELGRGQLTIELVGDTYDDASLEAVAHASATDAVLIPAFDDPAHHRRAGHRRLRADRAARLACPTCSCCPSAAGVCWPGAVAWLSGSGRSRRGWSAPSRRAPRA